MLGLTISLIATILPYISQALVGCSKLYLFTDIRLICSKKNVDYMLDSYTMEESVQ